MLKYRWLGVAGFEIIFDGYVLTVDPFFTRVPLCRVLFGRLTSDESLVQKYIQRCDSVLVSHSHYDHVLDVPAVARQTGALVYGSPNTSTLMRLMGVRETQIRTVLPGDEFCAGPFGVRVILGKHTRILGRHIATGSLARDLRPPLRAIDYRMDMSLSFMLTVRDRQVLLWNSVETKDAPRADILFVGLYREHAYYLALARKVMPRIMVPVHWDDMFRSLDRPLRCSVNPPVSLRMPKRADPRRLKSDVHTAIPQVSVEVPDIFKVTELL